MNRFLVIFISILLLCIWIFSFDKTNENFEYASDIEYTDYVSPYKSDTDKTEPIYYNQLDYKPVNNINCCLVQKKYLPDLSNQFGGSFKYKYLKLSNEQCDLKKYRLDNNKQLFIDGYNEWSNNRCDDDEKKNKIGSCRNVNKECIDFVDKEYCDKYHMIWSTKTCRDPFEYKWIDRTSFTKPIPKEDGSYIMFDKESQIGKDLKTSDNNFF